MRIKRFLALALALLCFATALSACVKKSPETVVEEEPNKPTDSSPLLDKIFNPAFEYSDNRIATMLSLEALGVIQPSSNQYFSIFKDENATYVYSNTENKVVKSLETVKTTSDVENNDGFSANMETCIISEQLPNVFAVVRYDVYNVDIAYHPELDAYIPMSPYTYEVTVEFCDTTGTVFHTLTTEDVIDACPDQRDIASFIQSVIRCSYGETDLFSIGSSVFSTSVIDGRVSYLNSFELTEVPSFSMMSAHYYYVLDNTFHTVSVYNTGLNKVATFVLTAEFFEIPGIIFPLPNGNLLFQRKKVLPADAEEYDLIKITKGSETVSVLKYDLLTTVIDIQNNEIYTENPNFVILEHFYSFSAIDARMGTEYYSKMYNRTLDTVIKIAYIDETKELLTDHSHTDIVAISNNCTVQRSLMLNKDWSSVPMLIEDDFYDVATVSGERNTVNRNGNVLFTYDSSKVTNLGKLSIGASAVYNRTTGEAIFKLPAEHTVISNQYSKAAFVTEVTSESNTLLHAILADGTVKALGITEGAEKNIDFFSVSEFGGYYVIKYTDSDGYVYFNEYGETLGTSADELTFVSKTVDGYILTNAQSGEYFKLSAKGYSIPNLYMSKK